jgi:hypothetical protein
MGYIYTTTDGWATFTGRTGPGSRNWYSVAISATNPMIQTAVVAGGNIYTTTDGWATFTGRTGPGSRYWYSVAMN